MFTTTLPIPPSVNAMFPSGKSGRRFASKAYTAWKLEAALWLKRHSAGSVDKDARYSVEYTFSFKDKRRRDLANFEKGLGDFLVDHGIIGDDSQIDYMVLVREENSDNTWVFITIREIAGK